MTGENRAILYILDVSFFTFRAYYALPPLSTEAGLPTNAVHGVASMLERLIKSESPRYLAAAFDSPGKTFRNDLYPSYKANRDEPDDDLKVQFPLVRRLVEAMSIRSLADTNYEADDIIASLARVATNSGFDVVIVTGDKDLMQCVDEHVTLFDPVRNKRTDIDGVKEKFGVAPCSVVEVQGLMGDSTDNIPGVRGVGPKTATALIQHFGSIERVYENLDEIESLPIRGAAGVRKKVEAGEPAARLSRDLATVRDDIDLDVRLEDLAFESLHTAQLLELAEELEMGRLAIRLRELVGADEARAPARDEQQVLIPAAVVAPAGFSDDWQALAGAEVVVVGYDDQGLGCRAMALASGDRRVLVVGDSQVRACVVELVRGGCVFCGHDLKRLCRSYGVVLHPDGIDLGVASYLYDPEAGSHDAADVTERFLGKTLAVASGAADDLALALDQTCRLVPIMRQALEAHGQSDLYRELEHPLLSILGAIEARGILLDVELLAELSAQLEERLQGLVGRVHEAAGEEFNILSPLQLRAILFDKLGLPSKGIKKTKTGLSTDTDSLHALAQHHPLPGLVLEYRGLSKLKSTYVDALPRLVDEDSRIHTRLNQTVTATGRLSSKDPNLQNIPIRTSEGARIREAFVAGPGQVLVSADYNQIELRVLADLSADPALIESFAKGLDIHTATAGEIFEVGEDQVSGEMRRAAKVINYGIVYGMGAVRLSRELGITRARAAEYINLYFDRYAGVKVFYAEMLERARRDGYVSTRFGRRRYLADIDSGNGGLRQAAERVATNTPIQGSAADIIKRAMVRLDTALGASGLAARMVLQIHDELLLECPKDELDQVVTVVREAMEGAAELAVPVAVDVGSGATWAAAH